VFAPDSVSVLDPTFLVSVPEPEMIPESVWSVDDANVNELDDPSETFPAYDPEPSEPDPDTVMDPPEFEIVVEPEYVLVADNVSVPALVFVTP